MPKLSVEDAATAALTNYTNEQIHIFRWMLRDVWNLTDEQFLAPGGRMDQLLAGARAAHRQRAVRDAQEAVDIAEADLRRAGARTGGDTDANDRDKAAQEVERARAELRLCQEDLEVHLALRSRKIDLDLPLDMPPDEA